MFAIIRGVPDGFRWCPSCKKAVAHEGFDRSSRTASGLASWCKTCKSAASRDAYFHRTYKITQQELAALREAQADRCAICQKSAPEHLDHDHSTGEIRQLLCTRCNMGLGQFRDDPSLLQMAVFYVEHHNQVHAIASLVEASSREADAASRPGEPPVGSQRRPGAAGTSPRSTGRTSGARRRERAGEGDA